MKSAITITKMKGAMVRAKPKTICTVDKHICSTAMTFEPCHCQWTHIVKWGKKNKKF